MTPTFAPATRRYATEAAADAASLFAQDGRQDSARRAAARARELHDAEQGGTPPRLEGLGPEAAIALTAREEQLVELARRGLGNAGRGRRWGRPARRRRPGARL
ncbi:hypothetical protein DSM104299_02088 [Baekduia alba]|uniref:hypothetical protein n=1 Tax=Baekduia alba TaxID=2997333 RepID=UPI0023405FF2|nr:hypothetical protein [Baekduia alba]WCB93375.1 hypothetical protein DSM104299_02088 [Baekduia alba]